MASCLGLYIEDNLIKYAKVTKDKELLKVDSFGIKIYDKLGESINQIISETFSYKIPISINLSEEMYNYFYFFNLLNNNDLKKAIETEFDSYCYDKGYNRNALESRYVITSDTQDKEKVKAIYISTNKAEINKKNQDLEGYQISNIVPLPMAIGNLADLKEKENVAIINLEQKTTITTILNKKINDITLIDENIWTILETISSKENSFAKAYEVCKNTTIYTMEGKELLEEDENLYLEDIMPTLYNIVSKTKELLENSLVKIDKLYITGIGSSINNIDLYFQECLGDIKCEILKPYFIPNSIKINIKDYIEVNSAIALAMQGLGYGIKNINFKKASFTDSLPDWMKLEIGDSKSKEKKTSKNEQLNKLNLSFNLKGKFDKTETWLLRSSIAIFTFAIIYSGISMFLNTQMNAKTKEIEETKIYMKEQISKAQSDTQKLNNKTTDYERILENLKNYNSELEQVNNTKNVIPDLLTRIKNSIPKGVTITSIENTTGSHIVIYAQSEKYDYLGYFKGEIIKTGILSPSTVVSTSGVKQDGIVKIVIEGDLP